MKPFPRVIDARSMAVLTGILSSMLVLFIVFTTSLASRIVQIPGFVMSILSSIIILIPVISMYLFAMILIPGPIIRYMNRKGIVTDGYPVLLNSIKSMCCNCSLCDSCINNGRSPNRDGIEAPVLSCTFYVKRGYM